MAVLPLVFVGGLLGSAHCVGMCGGFALTLGAGTGNLRNNVARQMVYSLGRIFTYSFGGAVVGYAALVADHRLPAITNVQAVFAVVAGVLLVIQGLISAGVVPWRRTYAGGGPCLSRSVFATFMTSPGMRNVFIAGVATGFLPCGLVYAYLALAASSTNMAAAMLTMAVFGLGTVPLMVLTGSGATLLSFAARRHVFRIAAWCVVLTGLVSIARGVGFLDLSGAAVAAGCPGCE